MNFSALKEQYRQGEISKADYIACALDCHRLLFAYPDVLAETAVREISIRADGLLFVMGEEGIRLHCPAGEARVAPLEILNFDQYEPAESAVLEALAAHSRCLLDIGANIGWYACLLARRHPELQVHAFEPLPATYSFLQRNIGENGLEERVKAWNIGFSDRNGEGNFHVYAGGGTNASLQNVSGARNAVEISARLWRLDDWRKEQTSLVPDLLKCDVEGAELLVLRGAEEILRRERPLVFAELLRKWCKPFGYHPSDLLKYMECCGYACYGINSRMLRPLHHVDEQTLETNYLFVPEEALTLWQERLKDCLPCP